MKLLKVLQKCCEKFAYILCNCCEIILLFQRLFAIKKKSFKIVEIKYKIPKTYLLKNKLKLWR